MSWRVKVVNMKHRDDYIKEREFTYTNKCYILNMGLTHVNLGYGEKLFNSLITGFFRTMRLVLSIETPMIKSNYKYANCNGHVYRRFLGKFGLNERKKFRLAF